MHVQNGSRWWYQQIALLVLLAALLLLIFEQTRLDLWLERFFYDPVQGDFPTRHHWFFTVVMHHGLKQVNYALLTLSVVTCLWAMQGKFAWLPPRNALLALAGMLLIPLSTALLKQIINRHCPWDVIEFGGYAPYIGLFATPPQDIGRGMCFPAGHASGGFAWIVWALALAHSRKTWSRAFLVFALAFGLAMGLARMTQGAHFLSHTLWAAWWAWALSLLLAYLFSARILADVPADQETRRAAPSVS
ncbi:MAG: phosphatase PAP2 family protein [Rhodocyclaceae bacterium]|jgi:membrane-associated PAP2 superfamily phosphatase|nr:phosphatase PAP2 family protein [Rhodocyclaceae bacterium]